MPMFSYIFGLGQPSNHLIEVVGAFLPAVLGALLVFPVYFIGRELFGKSCGLVSALIIAVLPGQVLSRTTLGFTDHHGGEILFSSLTMMFLLLALRSGKSMSFAAVQRNLSAFKRPLLYSALAGVSLGLYIDAWSSGFLFEGIILLFIMLQSIFDHIRGKNVEYLGISGAITFLVATLLVLPFVDSSLGFNHYLYSLFQPTILLLGVVAVIFFCCPVQVHQRKGIRELLLSRRIGGIGGHRHNHTLLCRSSVHQAASGGTCHIPAEDGWRSNGWGGLGIVLQWRTVLLWQCHHIVSWNWLQSRSYSYLPPA